MEATRPAFTRLFESDGFSAYFNTNNPVKTKFPKNILTRAGFSEVETLDHEIAAYWIIEGYLYELVTIDDAKYPTIAAYLKERDTMNLQARWDYYSENVDTTETLIVVIAYNKTRLNVYETNADATDSQKKKS